LSQFVVVDLIGRQRQSFFNASCRAPPCIQHAKDLKIFAFVVARKLFMGPVDDLW
jgi:hypothetical protein